MRRAVSHRTPACRSHIPQSWSKSFLASLGYLINSRNLIGCLSLRRCLRSACPNHDGCLHTSTVHPFAFHTVPLARSCFLKPWGQLLLTRGPSKSGTISLPPKLRTWQMAWLISGARMKDSSTSFDADRRLALNMLQVRRMRRSFSNQSCNSHCGMDA